MEADALALGLLLFEPVVVPRPTPGWFRISRYLVRGSWRALRAIRDGSPDRSYDRVLGLFAPAMAVALLAAWLVTLIFGYGLLMFALRDQLRPVPPDFGTALYFAATSVLTLGFGDVVAVALVVTFLFSLYGSYQRREVKVVTLQATAGAPPSAVALLESYAQIDLL